MKWEVSKEDSGIKLLAFIKSQLKESYSSRQLKDAIERGLCQINHRVERFASTMLGEGDIIVFHLDRLKSVLSVTSVSQSRVLYVDEDILVYNKPVGVVSDDPEFLKGIQKLFSGSRLVHRLDKETSGALLMARHQPVFLALCELFKARVVSKTYLAIVDGKLKKHSGVIENYLGKLHSYQGQTVWGKVSQEKGVFAKTSWKLQKKGSEASLIVCYPETGRTHQIRIHLSGLGHPILGDNQYGRQFECSYIPQRCLLHALEISFEHPVKKEILTIKAPIPEDFKEAMTILFPESVGEL